MTNDELIRRAFDAYNRQDSGALLGLVSDDVLWPGEARTLRGKDELRAFLKQQWTRTRTHDEVALSPADWTGRACGIGAAVV